MGEAVDCLFPKERPEYQLVQRFHRGGWTRLTDICRILPDPYLTLCGRGADGRSQFWAIIDAGRRKALTDLECQLTSIRKQLCKLSPGEDRGFHRQSNQKLADAYTWALCGAPSAALSGYFLWQDRPDK